MNNINNKLEQINKLIQGENDKPHDLLGKHKLKNGDIIIRCFYINVKEIKIINDKTKTIYKMEETGIENFYEYNMGKKDFNYYLEITNNSGDTWSTYDPYSFKCELTEVDLYLFSEGTHYRTYEKLGSQFKEIDGINGVSFVIWAPNAKRVSVVGDFNNWDGNRNPMYFHNTAGLWEIFIPGLKEFDKYKFEIKTKDNHILDKSDPYGFYFEVRPNKASIVYNIKNNYKWSDSSWMEKRKSKKGLDVVNEPINVYEVHLGSWARKVEEGNRFLTYREFAVDLVEYVKEMGYTHIELLPILEHPYDPSWGYQVTGYFAPTSRFGTPDDFKYFIDECHKNNIGVILDWVPAHFPKDDNGLAKFDGTSLYEHSDPRQGEHPEWGTLIFNYGRKEVKNFLISNALFWINEYHIDGLRTDAVASMLYLDYGKEDGQWVPNEYGGRENIEAIEFMKHLNSILFKNDESILMIAEESTSWGKVSDTVENGGLGFNLKWNMGWMNDFLSYIEKDCIHRKYDHHKLTFGMYYHYTEKFMLVFSHDEVVHGKKSILSKMPGDFWQQIANLKVTLGFKFGHPGKKLLFMGQEFGQIDEWAEHRSLDWHLLENGKHKEIQTYVKDLNKLYKDEKALWELDFNENGFNWIDCNDGDSSIVTFTRRGKNKEDVLTFICNFTPVAHNYYQIHLPDEGEYKEIFNSDELKYGGSGVINNGKIEAKKEFFNGVHIKVPPLGVIVFKKK